MATLLATGTHPRLILTSTTASSIRANLIADKTAYFQPWVNRMDSAAVYNQTTTVGTAGLSADVINFAFLYAIGAGTGDGHADFANQVTFTHTNAEYRDKAIQLFNAGVVGGFEHSNMCYAYDWLFNVLSNAEKDAAIALLNSYDLDVAAQLNTASPFDDQPCASRIRYCLAGLAVYNDRGNTIGVTQVNDFDDLMFGLGSGMWDGREACGGTEGGFPQNLPYLQHKSLGANPKYNYEQLMAFVMESYRTAATETSQDSFWSTKYFLQTIPSLISYFLQPDGVAGSYWCGRAWKDEHSQPLDNSTIFPDVLYTIRGLFRTSQPTIAGVAQWLCNLISVSTADSNKRDYWLWNQLLSGRAITAIDPVTAGYEQAKKFTTGGIIIARTLFNSAWHYIPDTWVAFSSPKFSHHGSYWHTAPGDIQLHRRGPVLIRSGSKSHQSYGGNAICGNTVIFPAADIANEPARITSASNSGHAFGSMRLNWTNITNLNSATVGWSTGLQPDVTGCRRYEANSHYVYAHGDCTRAYDSTSQAGGGALVRVVRFTRSFLWFKPQTNGANDRLVIFDRCETPSTTYEKRQLWHPATIPTVGGSSAAGPSRWGTTHGKTQYTGSGNSAINWTPSSGVKAFLTPILPTSRTVVVVGGVSATRGEWGRPNSLTNATGDKRFVSSITRSGTTATVTTTANHGFSDGDVVQLSGIPVAEYDTTTTISNLTANTFDFTVSGTPANVTGNSTMFVARDPSHEFEDAWGHVIPDSENSQYTPGIPSSAERTGQYRIELIPTTNQTQTDFCTILEVTEAAGSQSTTQRINGTNMDGVMCGTQIALFAPISSTTYTLQVTGQPSASVPPEESRQTSWGFSIPSAGTYKVFIADLDTANSYSPTGTGATITDAQTGSSGPFTPTSAGTLYLQVVTTLSNTDITAGSVSGPSISCSTGGESIVTASVEQDTGVGGSIPGTRGAYRIPKWRF